MNTIAFTMIIYLLGLVLVGIHAGRKVKTAGDFMVAGRNLPIWAATLTLTATMFGGGLMIGRAQYGYNNGFIVFPYAFPTLVAFVLLSFMLPKMKGFSTFSTVSEYLESRYGSRFLRVACAFLSLVAMIGLIASQVISVVAIAQTMGVGNPTLLAVLAMILVIGLSAFGGIQSVTATDIYQIVVVAIGTIWLFLMVLFYTGGFQDVTIGLTAMSESLPTEFTQIFTPDKLGTLAKMSIPTIMYMLIGQDGYQRLFSTRSLRDARIVSASAGTLMTLIALMPSTIGVVARWQFPELAEQGQSAAALAMMIKAYLPGIATGVLFAAILAAILSTADSLLTAATSHFVNDFWILFVQKDVNYDDPKLLQASRIAALVFGVFALSISMFLTDIIGTCVYCYTLYTAGAFVPIVLGCLWKKTTKQGAITGLFAGVIFVAYAKTTGLTIGPLPAEALSVVFAAIAAVIVSLATAPRLSEPGNV